MSILYTSDYGWLISHENFVKNVYKNVQSNNDNNNYQLKQVLFNITSPFLKNSKNDSSTKDNLKTLKVVKRKHNLSNNKTNFNELKQEVDFIRITYNYLDFQSIFNANIVTVKSNKEAQNEAEKCYNETDKCVILNSFGFNENQPIFQTINGASFIFPKSCKFYCKNVIEMRNVLTEEFDVILLDPPWWNKYIRRKNAKTKQGYQMMYNLDLSEIPIDMILSKDGLVVIWCTNAPHHLKDLLEKIFPKWGVRFVAKWFWLKVTKNGEPICDFAEPPCKQPFEQIIFGTRVTNSENLVPNKKIVISIPSALHSHKPPLTDLLSLFVGQDRRCLEIFARYLLPGWTSWGLEALKLQHESLYELQT